MWLFASQVSSEYYSNINTDNLEVGADKQHSPVRLITDVDLNINNLRKIFLFFY